jgi:Ca2+-transporting ATPase
MLSSFGPIGININKIGEINVKLAADGLRVLGIAMREWDCLPENISPETIETELVFLGLAGMIDPPRDEAREAVRLCKTAGISPVMITGDHQVTAQAIAKRLEIIDDTSGIIEGNKLSGMYAHDLEKHIKDIRVYARISPEQKLRIVKALKNTNQFVAMTGDGVNDAPALRIADIGVAMGITGTDVAKEASDMILLDDNFATLVKAVREGRRIYDNIIKFLTYSLTSNASTLWLIFLAPFFGLPLPLLPIQILWMNLLCDSLPGLALTMEPADKNVMRRPPRPFDEGVFSEGRGTFIITFGFVIGMTFLIFQMITVKQAIPWQTILFTSLVLGRMAILMGVRSQYALPFSLDIFRNKFLFVSIIITFGLQVAVVYFPFLNTIFKTEPLEPLEFLITLMFSVTPLLIIELKKLCTRIVPKKRVNR